MFVDRSEAGEHLAAKLLDDPLNREAPKDELLVLSIPRGGGAVVARILGCAHEIVAVKKIGFPGQGELAIGAIAEDGTMVLNRQIANWFEPEGADYFAQAVDQVKVQIAAYIPEIPARTGARLTIQDCDCG